MHRFFVEPSLLLSDEVALDQEVLQHMVVVRLGVGQEIELLDGKGLVCLCRVESLGKKSGTARVLSRQHRQETAFAVRLLQGIPKGDKMDLVLQKGTELGISRFSPMASSRCVPLLEGEREHKRHQRWSRILSEAARQSRRPVLPVLDPPLNFDRALKDTTEELRLMLWEEESRPLPEALPPATPASVAILVGPEGGFSEEEAQRARAAGFVSVRFGPRILRSETAGFALASILQYLYGDLSKGDCES